MLNLLLLIAVVVPPVFPPVVAMPAQAPVAIPGPVLAQDAIMEPTEKDLRETFRKAYGSTDEAARAEAVTTLSNASRSLSDGGTSKLMARTLAGALVDDSQAVLAAAIGALAWGRHVETAIDALGSTLHELQNEAAKLATRPDEESRTRRRQASRLYGQVCVALGRHADDRALEVLQDELRKQRPRTGASVVSEEFVAPLSTALLELGSHEAVETVVTTTGIFSGSVLRNSVSTGTAKALHQALATFSEKIGYGPPAYSDTYDQSWRAWFKKYEDELPAKLGKLQEPVPAPEYRRPDRDPNRRQPGKRERP
jgi:hypothetical protein